VIWMSPSLVARGCFEKGGALLRLDKREYAASGAREGCRDVHGSGTRGCCRSRLENALRASRVADAALKGARAALEQAQRDLLRRYGLTMDQVADAIRRTSLDIRGGNTKTESGEILLCTNGQAYSGED
jgi:hypothetical protein